MKLNRLLSLLLAGVMANAIQEGKQGQDQAPAEAEAPAAE